MRKYDNIFKTIYVVGTIVFLCIQIFFGILLSGHLQVNKHLIVISFVCANLICGIVVIILLRKNIKRIFTKVNDILELAIENNEIEEMDTETEIDAIITKIAKYMRSNRETLEQAVKTKKEYEQLISNISHQTKIPISNILIFAELLKENLKNEENKKYINNIMGQTEKLKWLILSFVNMSRLESGIIQYQIKDYTIQELLAATLTSIYADAEKKNIFIDIQGNTEYKGKFDLKWTTEAIVNILNNSIKYSPIDSKVDIEVGILSHYITLSIKDYGIGILPEEIPAIFGRLYRGKNAAVYDGIGIGLYLTREILTDQGGYIVFSKKETVGSKAVIYLPKT